MKCSKDIKKVVLLFFWYFGSLFSFHSNTKLLIFSPMCKYFISIEGLYWFQLIVFSVYSSYTRQSYTVDKLQKFY